MAYVAVKNFELPVFVVYVPNVVCKRRSFFQRLGSLFDDQKQLMFVGGRNVILDPKLDKAGRGACGSN